MSQHSNLSFRLLILLCITLLNIGFLNALHAEQKISGKITNVITSAGFTYAEVDTGKERVWAAGTGNTPLKKGDIIAFTTEMTMQDFYSKSLNRNFSKIYFVTEFLTDKITIPTQAPHGLPPQKPAIKPYTAMKSKISSEVKTGGYLREATLDGLNGKDKKFSDFRGKPLIINVWASWCGPCRAEMGSLQQLANRYNGKEFNIIGISTDDYRDRAEKFIQQAELNFQNYIDHNLVLEKMLGANTIPLTILVDEQGLVLEKVRGAREWNSPEIMEAIGKVLQIDIKL